MEVVVLAVIGLVVLGGIVAFAVGHKGWSWGTIAAAILLLLATTGYIYLSARLAAREQAWRTLVAGQQAKIDGILGTGKAAPADSLATLRRKRDRWTRALEFVDTWRGRSWKSPDFKPPRDGRPGELSIPMASEKGKKTPLELGAEIAVFDDADVKDEGRFLGLFRVQAVKANEGAELCQITVVPASLPAPPDAADVKLWTRNYEAVTVYEGLPVDRWLAFHRTPEEAAGSPMPTGNSADRFRPQPKKTSAEEHLASLEAEMEAFTRHEEPVPEDQWPDLAGRVADGAIPPGRYWAIVKFTKKVRFTRKDRAFRLDDDSAPETKPAGDDGAEGDIGAPGEAVGEMIVDDNALIPSEPGEPTAGASTNRFRSGQFNEGDSAEFDLQTALDLQDKYQFAQITDVLERRPLADPLTAIRGGRFKTQDGTSVRAEGIDALRQALLVEITSFEETLLRVKRSRENVLAQAAAMAEEAAQLGDDLTSWGKDVTAAEAMAGAFDDRLRAATIELAALESSIVRLGRELDGNWTVLTEAIDAAAPR